MAFKTLHRKIIKIEQHKPHLKIGRKLWFSGRVSSSCFTNGTCHVTLVTNFVISQERGKYEIVITTNGTYPWSFVTQIFRGHL